MSLSTKLLAVISSFTLLLGAAVPCKSYAVELSIPEISAATVTASAEDAASLMRGYLKSHTSEFTVEIDNVSFSSDSAKRKEEMQALAKSMMYKAFEETGSGTDGDYLRFAVKSYKCSIRNSNTCKLTYMIEYYTTAAEEKALTSKLSEIIRSLSLDGMSDYNKIETLYKYVTSHVTYSEDVDDPYAYSAYNAVFKGNAVCQGIAQLMYRMYNDSGIPCRVIAGTSQDLSGRTPSGNHVWLIVKLNGIYYLIDPTWDLKKVSYRYFLKGTADFDSDVPQIVHTAQSESPLPFPDYNSAEFKQAYPISQYRYQPLKYTLGNVNGDSFIDSVDASLILAEYARISSQNYTAFTTDQQKCADVNSDSKIDSVDASKVLAYYAAVSSGSDIDLADYIKTH